MKIVIKVLINVHLLVNELCEYQNEQCNDKNNCIRVLLNHFLLKQDKMMSQTGLNVSFRLIF